MSYCVQVDDDVLSVEVRRESVRLYQKWPNDVKPQPEMFGPEGTTSMEISKSFLARILAFYDNSANREMSGLDVPAPMKTGI